MVDIAFLRALGSICILRYSCLILVPFVLFKFLKSESRATNTVNNSTVDETMDEIVVGFSPFRPRRYRISYIPEPEGIELRP